MFEGEDDQGDSNMLCKRLSFRTGRFWKGGAGDREGLVILKISMNAMRILAHYQPGTILQLVPDLQASLRKLIVSDRSETFGLSSLWSSPILQEIFQLGRSSSMKDTDTCFDKISPVIFAALSVRFHHKASAGGISN